MSYRQQLNFLMRVVSIALNTQSSGNLHTVRDNQSFEGVQLDLDEK